jgi:hypothetical protein
VRLAGQAAVVLIAEGGREVLELAGVNLPQTSLLSVSIEESEDLGLWIRLQREDQIHLFLLRWEYILGIDLPSGLGKIVGLKG